MFKSFKETIKHSAIYGLGNISSKLVGFLLLPLYTDYLTTSEYGILAIIEITGQILVSVFSLNIGTAMMRWSSEEKEESKKKSIIFTSLVATLIIAGLLLIILLPFSAKFSEIFFKTETFTDYFILLFLTSAFGIYNLIPLTIMRLREKSALFATLTTLKFAVTLLFNIYFLAYLKMGIEGILISQLIGQALLFLFSIPITLKNIVPKFKLSVLKEMINYGVPLVFSTIFALAFTMSDRFIIKIISGEASVGLYSLGHKIASVINMLILQSFQLGFLPIAYKKLGDPDEKRFFSKTLTYYTLLLVAAGLSVALFGKELLEILAQKASFRAAYSVIPIIAFAFVLKGIQYNFSLSFHYSKKTSYNALIVIISAIVNVTLNIWFVTAYGYVGAAYAMLISIFVMMLLSYYFGKKVYPIPFEIKRITVIIFIGAVFFTFSFLINDYSLFIRLIAKTAILFLFALAVLKSKVFSDDELSGLKRGIKDFASLVRRKNN